jgi:hypothetical protein
MSPIPFNGVTDRALDLYDTSVPMATYLPVRLQIMHLSSAFSVDIKLTMINFNVILGPNFRFLVSTLFIHMIHVSSSQLTFSRLVDQRWADGR